VIGVVAVIGSVIKIGFAAKEMKFRRPDVLVERRGRIECGDDPCLANAIGAGEARSPMNLNIGTGCVSQIVVTFTIDYPRVGPVADDRVGESLNGAKARRRSPGEEKMPRSGMRTLEYLATN